jgi:hypothetical protein
MGSTFTAQVIQICAVNARRNMIIPLSEVYRVLTRKQIEVLVLLGRGADVRCIAQMKDRHVNSIFAVLHRSRVALKRTPKRVWSLDELQELGRRLWEYQKDPTKGDRSFNEQTLQEGTRGDQADSKP